MAMSHAGCDHPRTPAGRAACRKAGGPSDAAKHINFAITHAQGSPLPPALRRGTTARQRRATALADARRELGTVKGRQPRTRVLRAEHDLADVPHAFGTVIRWAWDHELEVKTGLPFNETERQIIIQSEHGFLTLVWRAGQPFGVTAVWWRPCDTSVQKRLMTVQQGLMALESGVWE